MTARITKPGIYPDMADADYRADPCPEPSFTQSLAKIVLDQSALHASFDHPRLRPAGELDDPEPYSKAKAIGNAAHKLLIGRGKDLAVVDFDDWRKKEAQLAKAEAEKTGKVPVLAHHFADACRIENAARAQLVACGWADAFAAGHGEVVVAWEEDGLWFRTMIDWLTADKQFVFDLKTSGGSLAPHLIGRTAVDAGWDIQAAMHERALNAVDPENAGRRKFRFVAIENYPPYALVPVELSESWLTMGRKKLDVAIHIWRDAMAHGRFAGYPATPITPDYPGYRETEWLNREQTFHENVLALIERRTPMLTDLSGG